jgi:hypothetical protein
MARYVLLEFDDDNDAEAFAEMVKHGAPEATMRAVGMYKKPTMFCECPNPGDKSVLGKKYNWWVHKDCGRPKAGHWQNPRNLLKPDERIATRQQMISLIEPRQETFINAK